MKTLSLDIQDSVDFYEVEAKMLLAGKIYERGKPALVQAAQMTGLTKKSIYRNNREIQLFYR